jgi:hypothetical protein
LLLQELPRSSNSMECRISTYCISILWRALLSSHLRHHLPDTHLLWKVRHIESDCGTQPRSFKEDGLWSSADSRSDPGLRDAKTSLVQIPGLRDDMKSWDEVDVVICSGKRGKFVSVTMTASCLYLVCMEPRTCVPRDSLLDIVGSFAMQTELSIQDQQETVCCGAGTRSSSWLYRGRMRLRL